MAETVKVIVRCRPMNKRELDLKCKEVVQMDTKICACSIVNPADQKAPPKRFTFDGAYDTNSTTEAIYADIGFPLVEGVTEGYNGTIFAYGQTGCGKSFSMQGITDPPTQRGIIPRAFDHIFETIQLAEGTKYLVHASYLEIYNEEIRDLLGKEVKQKLDLKEHPEKGVYVQGLSMHPCTSVNECHKIMKRGWENRSVGATLMNADSSRSHSIFSIYLERIDADEQGEEHIRAAKLNLVDLAGSERQGKTGSTGDRLKEATKINLSLSALGNVISALVDGKSTHIPYRDSKLTRLLQDSLGGNTKTLMVACLSPADNNYDETLSTLRYANRAKNIKNKPKINEDPKDALLREYQDEITRLKAMLRGEIPLEIGDGKTQLHVHVGSKYNDGVGAAVAPRKPAVAAAVAPSAEEQCEIEQIREEYESKMYQMQQDFEQMRLSRDKMEEEMAKLRQVYDDRVSAVTAHVPSPGQADAHEGGAVRAGSAGTTGTAPTGPEVAVVSPIQREPGHESRAELMSVTSADMRSDSEDPAALQEQVVQHALHLATVRSVTEDGTARRPITPSTSPTGQHAAPHALSTDEAMRKLQALQNQMVGGEQMSNEEVKERHKRKKNHVEERKRRLAEALANMEGEDIMLDIYDNIQDQLRATQKALAKEKEKNESLQREIKDLQSEFEFDRIDYLDTIRKYEQNGMWKQEVINRIHPCLRRDCNYTNLDKIKMQSKWDEESQRWFMPKLLVEKTQLPNAPGALLPGMGGRPNVRGMSDEVLEDLRSENKYIQRLNEKEDDSMNYFKSKRQEQLLRARNGPSPLQGAGRGTRSPNQNGHVNGHVGVPAATQMAAPWQNDPLTYDQLKAAQVHGQISQEDFPVRKPARLDALPLQPPQTAGKKRSNKGVRSNHFM